MEVGTEISQKIRSAIKAKLMEIGSYVDDELPDYIMVMVANKKTQQQMTNDLCLFLGSNTEIFTSWLHGLLNKLQTVSSDSSKSEKSKNSKDKKKEKKTKDVGGESKKEKRKITKGGGDGDAPKAKSARTASTEKSDSNELQNKGQIVSENDSSLKNKDGEDQQSEIAEHNRNIETKLDDVEDVRQLLVQTPADELAEELEITEAGIEKLSSSKSVVKGTIVAEDREIISSTPETDAETAQVSKKRKCPSSVVTIRRDEEESHSSPVVASVVKVTSRKSSVPQSMQANSEPLSHSEDTGSEKPVLTCAAEDNQVSLNLVKQALSEVLVQWQDKEDDIRTFCKNVEKILRKMSPGDFAITKLKFQKILFDYEMSQHRQTSLSKNSKAHKGLPESPTVTTIDVSKRTHRETMAGPSLCRPENTDQNTPSTLSLHLNSPSTSQSQDNNVKLRDQGRQERISKDSGASSSQSNLSRMSKSGEDIAMRRIIFGAKKKEGENALPVKHSSNSNPPESCSLSNSNGGEMQLVSTAVSSTVIESSGLDSPSSSQHSKSVHIKWSTSSSPSHSKVGHPAGDPFPRPQTSGLHPITLVSSLHQKRRFDPDSPSVLRHSLSHDPPANKAAQGPSSEGVPDSSKEISPEQLKVLAKNLKITVVNKRALRPEDKSNSEDTSSDDSEDESESEEESDEAEGPQGHEGQVADKTKEPADDKVQQALLVKAMSEAERSIAIKRKIAVARPMSREDSPSEVYTPKRRKSETGKVEVSPPPYIPSKKETSSSSRSRTSTQDNTRHNSSKVDARQLLEKRQHSRISLPARERRELISRSRRIELFQKLGIGREEILSDRQRRLKENDKESQKRESESDIPEVRNFKITAHIAPSSRPSGTVKERLAKALEEKDHSFQVTVLPSSSIHKSGITSRLGKVVVHRRSSDLDREDRKVGIELKDKDRPAVRLSSTQGRRLALSLLGKEVVKRQCEAAVLSVKSVSARKYEQIEARDSRVVESHSSSEEEEPVREKSPVETVMARRDSISIKSERDSLDKDSEDLDDMLKDDLEPDLLQETFTDEFTLDLEDDEDLIKVVGQLEDEDDLTAGSKKSESKPGTRFIVTLDGVDERQFEGNQENQYPPYLPPTPTQPVMPRASPRLPVPTTPVAPDPAAGVFLLPQDPLAAGTPIKAAPPKIQPFSINLKDSDDEFEEKGDLKAFSTVTAYPQPVAGLSPGIEAAEGLTTLQKAKLSERCKFWPACAAGLECEFHHPTSYCKTFPNCKFGDKCLFIHPNCKFDSKCTRPDCPFTHTSRRPVLGASPQTFKSPLPKAVPYYPQYIPFSNSPSATVCKFFPNCQNISCPFIHPKPCRFGASCQNAACPFFHPATPTKDKLKWTANSDQHQQQPQVKEGMTKLLSPLAASKPKVTSAVLAAGCAADSSTNV